MSSENTNTLSTQKTDAFGSAADSTTTPPEQTNEAIVIPPSISEISQTIEHAIPSPVAKEKDPQLTVDTFIHMSTVESHKANSPAKVGVIIEDDNSNNSLNQEEILGLKKTNPSKALFHLQKLIELSVNVAIPAQVDPAEDDIEAPILCIICQLRDHIF